MTDPPKILIVDDTPANLELVQKVLRAEGFRTLTAADGESASVLARSDQPDLILLDVMMPDVSGFETCARLKLDSATTDIPIIFLSALDDVESKVTGLKIGGVDYIAKPFHREEMLARVRVHLRMHESNRAAMREHRARLEQLRDAQQAIMTRPEEVPEAGFAVYYKPLEETGGDFYDVFPLSADVFAYFVADISGHGVSAAFLTSAIKALLRQYTGPMFSPEDTMRSVDAVMRQLMTEEQYLTACFARLNCRSRRLSVISAGHPPLIVVRAAGETEVVKMDSDPLGVFSSAVLQRRDLWLARGDRFYMYTDGLIESSPGGGRQSGLERLSDACARHRAEPLENAVAAVVQETRPDAGAPSDDLLLLAVGAEL